MFVAAYPSIFVHIASIALFGDAPVRNCGLKHCLVVLWWCINRTYLNISYVMFGQWVDDFSVFVAVFPWILRHIVSVDVNDS